MSDRHQPSCVREEGRRGEEDLLRLSRTFGRVGRPLLLQPVPLDAGAGREAHRPRRKENECLHADRPRPIQTEVNMLDVMTYFWNQGWALISSTPLRPRRRSALQMRQLRKSRHSRDTRRRT